MFIRFYCDECDETMLMIIPDKYYNTQTFENLKICPNCGNERDAEISFSEKKESIK